MGSPSSIALSILPCLLTPSTAFKKKKEMSFSIPWFSRYSDCSLALPLVTLTQGPLLEIDLEMTDPTLLRASVTPISPLICDSPQEIMERGLDKALPIRRLHKDDRLNTWLFNRRLSLSWAFNTPFILDLPYETGMMAWGCYGFVGNLFPDRRKGKKRGGVRDIHWHDDHRFSFPWGCYLDNYHHLKHDSDFFWSDFFEWVECARVFGDDDQDLRLLLRYVMDPARDSRKLKDETVMLWQRKREAQGFILRRDHHLFIYLETAAFFWELTEQEKIK